MKEAFISELLPTHRNNNGLDRSVIIHMILGKAMVKVSSSKQ
jgi:hypothetical protein